MSFPPRLCRPQNAARSSVSIQNRFVSSTWIDLNDLSLWPRSVASSGGSSCTPRVFPPLLLTSQSVFQPHCTQASLLSSLLQCAAQGTVPLWFPSCPAGSLCSVLFNRSQSIEVIGLRLLVFLPSRQPRSWDGNGVPSLPLPAYPLAHPPSTTRGSANAQLECGWIQKRTTRDLYS